MKKIIFLAHKWYYIDAYKPVIEQLRNKGFEFRILILRPRNDSYGKYTAYGEKLLEPYYQSRLARFLYHPNPIPRALQVVLRILFFKHLAAKLMRKGGYYALVASNDCDVMSAIVISCAKKMKVKTVLYPMERPIFVDDLIDDKIIDQALRRARKQKIVSAISGVLYPGNVLKRNGKSAYYFRPRIAAEASFFRILPKNPWIRGFSTDIVTVNSSIQKAENCRWGQSEQRIHVVGFPPHDIVYNYLKKREKMRMAILENLKVKNSDKKMFLILGTHTNLGLYEEADHLKANLYFNNMLRRVISELGEDYTIILQPHPQVDLSNQINNIAEDLRDKIVFIKNEYSVYELIAVSDALLNFFSSCTYAALMTDMPIFLCYPYKRNYLVRKWSNRLKSVMHIENTQELRTALTQMRNNILLNGHLRRLRFIDRNNYGQFDGKNTERFLDILIRS